MLNEEKIEDEKDLIIGNIKLLNIKINKTKNNFFFKLISNLNFKKFIILKYIIFSLLFLFYLNFNFINIIINYLKNYNINYFNYFLFENKSLEKYNKKIFINNNIIENKKIKIPFNKKEIYSEIVNHKLFNYLVDNKTNDFNNYIKKCINGIFMDKNKYPLLKFPKISVIIPLYNAGKYLHYSLRSVQNQRMKEIEIILVDDCSKDNTLVLIKKFMKEDKRIKLIKNEVNRKILFSKSMAAINSNGKYILQLDQDDLFIRDDAFDLLYKEAEKNNLDLTQIRDIFIKKPYLDKKTRINFIGGHFIFLRKSKDNPIPTHYKTQPEIKYKMFINGCVFPLWGLLIKTEIYKKAIYHLWPFIMNYELVYYEDYLVSSFIVIFSSRFKYLNYFALLFYANILFNYYIKNNPNDIKICINLIKRYTYIYKPSYKIFSKLFEYNLAKILNNEYLSEGDKKFILKELKINPSKFKTWNSYQYIMNANDYNSILNFQNSNLKYKINNISIFPKISVIVYFDEFKYIYKTINSILNQNFVQYEILLIYDNNENYNLNIINKYIKRYKNIKIIYNKKRRGIFYSYSIGILSSQGYFILTLKLGETLASENVLNDLYRTIKTNNVDIVEFNLLLNNQNNIKINSLSLYKCKHFKKDINLDSFKYNKKEKEIYQEKDLLINKLIKGSLYKNIINKYKFIEYNRVIYNYYDEIILFLIFKINPIFKKINIFGVIKFINKIKIIKMYNLINNKNQKINDSIFYINFLFEKTSNSLEEKKIALNEFYNLLSIIYNKYNKISDESIRLFKKFINSKYITNFDKINLKFYFNSLLN